MQPEPAQAPIAQRLERRQFRHQRGRKRHDALRRSHGGSQRECRKERASQAGLSTSRWITSVRPVLKPTSQ